MFLCKELYVSKQGDNNSPESNHLNNATMMFFIGVLSFLFGFSIPFFWLATLLCAYGFFEEIGLHTEKKKQRAYEEEQKKLAEQKRILDYQTKQRELERQRQFEIERIRAEYEEYFEELSFKEWFTYYGNTGVALIIFVLLFCILLGMWLALIVKI